MHSQNFCNISLNDVSEKSIDISKRIESKIVISSLPDRDPLIRPDSVMNLDLRRMHHTAIIRFPDTLFYSRTSEPCAPALSQWKYQLVIKGRAQSELLAYYTERLWYFINNDTPWTFLSAGLTG